MNPKPGHQTRNKVKPTKQQRKLYKKLVEAAPTATEPDKVIRKAVTEVYQPTANVDMVIQATGLQQLVLAGEKRGITTAHTADKFYQGINHEDFNVSHKFLGLWARLRYPEAFRTNVNIDARTLNHYEGASTEELARLIEERRKNLQSR